VATSRPQDSPEAARNIILLIGDGMGVNHIRAARLNKVGPQGELAMDRLPVKGRMGTQPFEDAITDSAAAATAMATGAKTRNGYLSVSPLTGEPLETILEQAQVAGKATGLVVTSSLADATPAAFMAHSTDRNQPNRIVEQLLEHGVDVALGGGAQQFIPAGSFLDVASEPPGASCEGRRRDTRSLAREAEQFGYEVVTDREMLASVREAPVLGLFACLTMNFDRERLSAEPSLAEMTENALRLLSREPAGFFLMVEGSRIDHAAARGDSANVIGDVLAFDDAVAEALAFAETDPATLVIVAADHETGGLTIDLEPSETGPGADLNIPIAGNRDAKMRLVWSTSEHTAQEVVILAEGARSELAAEVGDNTDVYTLMAVAFGFKRLEAVVAPEPEATTEPAPIGELCSAEAERIRPSDTLPEARPSGTLKIGLTGHSNMWWQGTTGLGRSNVDRGELIAGLLNRQGLDFTVFLGDDFHICNPAETVLFTQVAARFDHPVIKVLGNHDLDDNPGETIDLSQRDRFERLFGREIYSYFDARGYRFVLLSAEAATGNSVVSAAQIKFLKEALDSSPYPVVVFAHHVLPVRQEEQLGAMIGAGSRNVVSILETVQESGKVVFWGWIHFYSTGRAPVQSQGIVVYSPHFLTGHVDGEDIDTLQTSVLTLGESTIEIKVFDVISARVLQTYSFGLPQVMN
jgi:alkaline phosphatase